MNRILLIILSTVILSWHMLAFADRIVAVVEDTSITLSELEQRKKLIGFFNQVKNLTPEQDKSYSKMVLQGMIDDQVLLEYAKSISITIPASEIDTFISNLEMNGKMQPGQITNTIVNDLHISLEEFRHKIRVEIIRSKIIRELLSRNLNISQDDVESMVLATNFRDAKLKLKIFTAKNDSKKTIKSMEDLSRRIKSCKKLRYLNYKSFADISDLDINLSQLSPFMQTLVKDIDIDKASDVIEDEQIRVVVVCERTLEQFSTEDSNSVQNFLGNKKLQIKAQKFFQDLRKKAYIKILL